MTTHTPAAQCGGFSLATRLRDQAMNAAQIERSLEIRRHNGQCAFGPWMTADEITSRDVVDAIVDEVIEANCRDMRREDGNSNTDSRGRVMVGGEVFLYRR